MVDVRDDTKVPDIRNGHLVAETKTATELARQKEQRQAQWNRTSRARLSAS
jgi:hypothetical protein